MVVAGTALVIALLSSPLPLRVETDLCAYAVEFDVRRISRDRLEALLRLRDGWAGCWMGELWDASPPEIATRADLEKMEAVLARFDEAMKKARPPPSLAPVVRWTRDWMEYLIWRDRALHDFCAGDASALRRAHRDVRPAEVCAAEIEEASSKWFGKCEAARMGWGNCVNHARSSPEFPAASWERFLREQGIRLRKLECDEP